MDIEKKREEEKQVIGEMVKLFCRGKKHQAEGKNLCSQCAALLDYAQSRTDRCPRMAEKTFCSKCPSPCYRPEQRAEIRAVMRYAGPRMLLHHPILTVRHMLVPKEKRASGKKRAAGS